MSMSMSIILNGYHGTSKINANSILKSKTFFPIGNMYDWLGKGVYFFENDKHQAYMITKARKKLSHEKISILNAQIETKEGQYLDLTIDDDRQFSEGVFISV